ncbi:apolipoprotein A-II [Clarias gariepinus]|uniref:apolipoprotein A-II n=1 Tax=Clarias gariepinus TaxID=13013 RepID=UPI00234DE60D|nr:apolipoprotein A-II [Clarias gariepinus]
MKLALALILALQVSLCLCEVADPPEELVKKYEGLKTTFLKRAANAYAFLHTFFENLLENTITGGKIKELGEAAKGNDRLQAISKLAHAVFEEMQPGIEKARLKALGAYSEYLRPYIGTYLDTVINNAKPVLDSIVPAE